MKRLTIAGLLLVALFSGGIANAADFGEGLRAYKKGDYITTLQELKPLAEQGHASAQFNLGWRYQEGWGVPQDYSQAVKFYSLAAEQGEALAQYNLGVMYGEGLSVSQNYKQAAQWIRLAAEQGLAEAQYNLGMMYEKGQGVLQDNIRAHMWFNIAASAVGYTASYLRDSLAEKMSKEDIATAQKRASQCVASNYENC